MATNAEVIGDALRELNVIAEGQSVSAEQGLHGLRKLNEMIEEWTEREIELGYFAQDDGTDTCPIPPWAEKAVKLSLAIEMAPKYGATVSAELAMNALKAFQVVQRKSIVEKMQPANMDHLPLGSGKLGGWTDITQ